MHDAVRGEKVAELVNAGSTGLFGVFLHLLSLDDLVGQLGSRARLGEVGILNLPFSVQRFLDEVGDLLPAAAFVLLGPSSSSPSVLALCSPS